MNSKIRVGVIGATGMVGQNFLALLEKHPWFEPTFLAASSRSAGLRYEDAVRGRWRIESPLPDNVRNLPVYDAWDIEAAERRCDMVFSAISLSKEETGRLEKEYARRGFPVVSNNSAHRETDNIPLVIPEINFPLLEALHEQQDREGYNGFIVTKPNCGLQSYLLPIDALRKAGYQIKEIITTNLQALSGSGYPGVSALDVVDNLAALPSEEEKVFTEPQKIFGSWKDGVIVPEEGLSISSNCIRVPVVHGHTSCVWFKIENGAPELEELAKALEEYTSEPQRLELPSAPQPVIRYFADDEHPTPRADRDASGGMAVTVGRLQKSPVLGYRFTSLSHNTRRGAAGGAVLTAELLAAKGMLKKGDAVRTAKPAALAAV